MLLIHIDKITPRISYIFKHICLRILGIDISFSTALEPFIAHKGPKMSYGKKAMGNEIFFQSFGLLEQQGFDTLEISVKKWGDTVGFFPVSNTSALPFDIFAASFYMITRYEEYLPHVKDEMGRFMASESLAFKYGFLNQPVVDIWAYKFKDKLKEAFPGLPFPKKKMIIHPVVAATEPFVFKYKGLLRSALGYANDLFRGKFRNVGERSKVILSLKRDPVDNFKWLINNARHSNFKLTVFFLLGNALNFQEGMNTHRKKFKLLLKYVSDYKEVGLIFSYDVLTDYEKLKSEKRRMEHITNRAVLSSMNAEFLVHLPDIYRNLVELQVKRDFTMVFRDTVGFRAGTCTPFLFYDLDYEVKTPLVIQPATMTSQAFNKRYSADIEKTVNGFLAEVEKVNGTFTLIFSNSDFTSNEDNKVWRSIFSERLPNYAD
ncbi:hypothetical protein EI546_07540 [Aequorivita sp. H23M31]|uniref:DUF7033 domain-containing protein n=1 Tax=Aequorivita ciconiae TaxID=2494375 RepID=A0A410G2U6_9FLAO|nr:hypothetical protein [Aequorivita sp. H23M31]QAA81586.1 hypothetical protein EI546_07540 [Aequorivita sp. H23M31]